MPDNKKTNGSLNRKFRGWKVSLIIIFICVILFSLAIYSVTITEQIHSYQGLSISLQEDGSNIQIIETNGLTANLSSSIDKTLCCAPALTIGANQSLKDDISLSSMTMTSPQPSLLIEITNDSSNKTWELFGNSFFLTLPHGDQVLNQLFFNFTTAYLQVNPVYPSLNFTTKIAVDKYNIEYAVVTVHNNQTGKNTTKIVPESIPVYESFINSDHCVANFGVKANTSKSGGLLMRMSIPTSVGFSVNNVYYSAPASTITIDGAQSVSFSGQTENIFRIPLDSINELNFAAFGPPYPNLHINSKNMALLDTDNGSSITGSYNLTMRSLSTVQMYIFEYENFSNLNLNGFYYYVLDIHSSSAVVYSPSGYLFTSTSFVNPLWVRTLATLVAGSLITIIIEELRNLLKDKDK